PMKNRSCCNLAPTAPATDMREKSFSGVPRNASHFAASGRGIMLLIAVALLAALPSRAADAPSWMHAAATAPVPAPDDKTDPVILYSDRVVTVQSADKIKTHVRIVYKILRPGGRDYGIVAVPFNAHSKITALRGWCIPAQGKDYEVKDKEAVEVSLR